MKSLLYYSSVYKIFFQLTKEQKYEYVRISYRLISLICRGRGDR